MTYVKCRKCYAKSGFFILEEYESHEEAWADAVRHWNTRADWIPVGEQLPDTPHEQIVEIDFDEYEIDHYSDEVHIYDEIEGLVRGRLYLEGSNHRPLWADIDGIPLLKVTHWAPMPKKPE